jgi:hypothetical protein
MNSDSEAFQRHLIAWLLQDPASTAAPENGECNHIDGVEDSLIDTAVRYSAKGSGFSPHPFELGDIPAVQDRFHAVLKRRLQIEIQQHPPRFPWETEGFDYPERVDAVSVEPIPTSMWTVQQQNLRLPIPLPEPVFERLLNQCQVVGRMASLQMGAKLVQAVENLFPGESQTLNHLAGVVLMSPSRGPVTPPVPTPDLESEYSALYPPQQMVLSLLAARQLLDTLTVVISPVQPVVRQWLTAAGLLNLQAEYQQPDGITQVRVQAELPCGGSLQLQSGRARATAQRSDSGYLSVELHQLQLSQNCSLEVQLPYTQDPLTFTICLTL